MAFYDNYVSSISAPKNYWKEQLQEVVNQSFENASTIQFDIEEEDEFGSMMFHPVECRITSLVDAKTGQRNNDDYRKIIFKDLTKEPVIGTRYRFEDNIWMCFSTDNIKTDTSSAYLRRCNNVITTEDKYGKIHEEPCYIDYKVNETQLFQEYTMTTPAARIVVTCQTNKYTKDININDRYIFNNQVYRIREFNSFDRLKTFDNNTSYLISFHADVDAINNADRFDIRVADYFKPAYKVVSQNIINNIVGYTNKVDCHVEFMNEIVDEPVLYESTNTDICSINQYNGQYQLKQVGACKIYCKLFNNQNIVSVVDVVVEDSLPDTIVNVIEPDITYIKLNTTQTYTIYAYRQGIKLDTKFNIEAYDIPENCFDFSTTTNSFTIKYKRLYEDGLLKVVCTNLDTNEKTTFYIELGGIW